MNRFLRNIALFAGIVLAAGLALFALPLDRKFAYRFIRGDCYQHGAWVWQRLAENPASADIAFVGSSHTLHAVWEKAVEDSLTLAGHRGLKLLNLGYCRLGNNLGYALARDLFVHKKPRLLVWEVRETEESNGHPMYGYLAEPRDLLWPAAGPHARMLADLWNAANVRLEFLRAGCFGSALWQLPVDSSRFGYGQDATVADASKLEAIRTRNAVKTHQAPSAMPTLARVYLEKTLALAQRNGTQVLFLYLPDFGAAETKPAFLNWYKNRGSVLLPPQGLLDNPSNWLDHAHLNDRGAAQLAGWLAGALSSYY